MRKVIFGFVAVMALFSGNANALDETALTEGFAATIANGDLSEGQSMNDYAIRYNKAMTPGTEFNNGVATRVSTVVHQGPLRTHDDICEAAFSMAVIAAGTRDVKETFDTIGFTKEAKWKPALAYMAKHPTWVSDVRDAVSVSNDGFYSEDHSVLVRSCVADF